MASNKRHGSNTMIYARPITRRSSDACWPLKRADGSLWNEAPGEGYNPLGKERDARQPRYGDRPLELWRVRMVEEKVA